MGICMRYCTDPDDAAEIVNDGFLKIFRALDSFNPQYSDIEASLKGWMKRIIINTAHRSFEKKQTTFFGC